MIAWACTTPHTTTPGQTERSAPPRIESAGEWIGTMRIEGDAFQVHLDMNDRGRTIDLPTMGAFGLDLLRGTNEGERFRLRFDKRTGGWSAGEWELVCTPVHDQLSCEARHGSERAELVLSRVHVARSDAMHLERFVGGYSGAGERWSFARVGGHLLRTDRLLAVELYPIAARAFTTEGHDTLTFELDASGDPVGARWSRPDGTTSQASRDARRYDAEELVFSNGAVRLRGTLRTPLGAGPHPAIVLVHGSSPGEGYQAYFELLADHFADNGVAVFAFDKRGTGLSTGDWKTASFQDLANDVVAAIGAVKRAPRIDAHRIGLWGISQGGWILPMVATSPSSQVAFLILASAPAVSPAQQELSRVEHEMRSDGLAKEEVEEALRFVRQYVDVALSGAGREALDRAMVEARSKRWSRYPAVLLAGESKQAIDTALRITAEARDPIATLRRVRCPVLAIYGQRDQVVRVDENRALMEDALRSGGNRDVTISVIPGADHAFFPSKTGGREELLRSASRGIQLAPGFLDTMTRWLASHAFGR
jgi:alpha-beta hydrolase superfamily lysophospholipase